MGGLHPRRDPEDPLHVMMELLTGLGFTGVLGTNCEQSYDRYLTIGDELSVTTRLESVVGPKQTGVGEGYFVTTRNVWRDARGEQVATMLFRVLKFRPRAAGGTDQEFVLRPTVNRDSAYFWEGTAAGELRLQRCRQCGALRHPPGPACPACHALDPEHVVASGRGTLHSYVVHRHPPVPGYELPILIGLVDLEEGVRMVAAVTEVEPEAVAIGMPLEVGFRRIDDGLTLPVFRPAGTVETAPEPRPAAPAPEGEPLPPWTLPVTTTLVVSTALATRDFQDVHHDRDLARSYGSPDIFVNILTSNGLVERFVTDALGQDLDVRSISIRLGAPAYPGDTLTFTGAVTADDDGVLTVAVRGAVAAGDHVTGTVVVAR
jgi:uncharacterized OB-fold protein